MQIGNRFGSNTVNTKSTQDKNASNNVNFTARPGKPILIVRNDKALVIDDLEGYYKKLGDAANKAIGVKVITCANNVNLSAVLKATENSKIKVFAQNFKLGSASTVDALTLDLLKSLGSTKKRITGFVAGHYDVRTNGGETRKSVIQKMNLFNRKGPENGESILCIGEKPGENPYRVIREAIVKEFKTVPKNKRKNIILAYEPGSAIDAKGFTAVPCPPAEANKRARFMRNVIAKIMGKEAAEDATILYGGSAKVKTANGYLQETIIEPVKKTVNGVTTSSEVAKRGEFDGLFIASGMNKAEDAVEIVNDASKISVEINGEAGAAAITA